MTRETVATETPAASATVLIDIFESLIADPDVAALRFIRANVHAGDNDLCRGHRLPIVARERATRSTAMFKYMLLILPLLYPNGPSMAANAAGKKAGSSGSGVFELPTRPEVCT
jgi:hypothetical protein